MGCCASRLDDPLKFASQTLEPKPLDSLIEDPAFSAEILDPKAPGLSLREVLNRPLKTIINAKNTNNNLTPEPQSQLLPILILKKSLGRETIGQKKILRFEASFQEEIEELVQLENFKSFEIDVLKIESPEDYGVLEYMEKLRPVMRRNCENMAFLFNYELSNCNNFLIRPMISQKRISVLNSFHVFLYKEFLDTKLSDFIDRNVIKPGIFEENHLISLLFNISKVLLSFRSLGLEFEDLDETFFALDGKGLGHLKFDPTIRLFHNFNAKQIENVAEKNNGNYEKNQENSNRLSEKKEKIERKNSEQVPKIDKKCVVLGLGSIFLSLAVGHFQEKLKKAEIFERYQEVLTIKYPKLWYFLDKMLEDKPDSRISLEELCTKRDLLQNEESTSFLRYFIGIENKDFESKDFKESLDLIEGNIAIFQHSVALKLIKGETDALLKNGASLFDVNIVEMRKKAAKIYLQTEDYTKALEELYFLEQAAFLFEKPVFSLLEVKYDLAVCYKSLGKTKKSLELLFEITKTALYSVPEITSIGQRTLNTISKMGAKALKDSSDNKEILNEITTNSMNGLNELQQLTQNSVFGLQALTLAAEIHQEMKEFTESKLVLEKALGYSRLFYSSENDFKINKTSKNGENNGEIALNNDICNCKLEVRSIQADIFELLSREAMLNEENHVESLDFMKSAHQLRKPIYNSETMLMIRSYKYLAICSLNVGDLKQSLKAINKNLSLLKTLESFSPFTKTLDKLKRLQAESLKLRSKIEIELGETDKAEKTYKEVLEIYEELDSFYSPSLVHELQGLACFYSTCNAYPKALETFKIAAEVTKNVFGERSLEMAAHWKLMGEFYEDNAKYSEAVEAFLECLNRKLEIYGGLNEKMIDLLMKISKNYEFLGFNSKACEFAEKGLELMREKFGIQPHLNHHLSSPLPNQKKQHQGSPFIKSTNNSLPNSNINSNYQSNQSSPKKKNESPRKKKMIENIRRTKSVQNEEHKLMVIECLFRLGGLYRKMGMINKSRDCFQEEKRMSTS